MGRIRIDVMVEKRTLNLLDAIVKNARINGSRLCNRGRILDLLIQKADPIDNAREQMKYHQVELMKWKDHIQKLEEVAQKK